MPQDVTKRTLVLPKDLDTLLHEKMYREYSGQTPYFNTYLVKILRDWVKRPDTL